MLFHRKTIIFVLALCLCAGLLSAQAAGLKNPESYVGDWEGGEHYGDARDYYMYIMDYSNGTFTLNFDLYRLWGFENMTALLSSDRPTAIFSTSEEDDYTVIGAMDFYDGGIEVYVLDSDYPDLPSGTVIQFEPAKFEDD